MPTSLCADRPTARVRRRGGSAGSRDSQPDGQQDEILDQLSQELNVLKLAVHCDKVPPAEAHPRKASVLLAFACTLFLGSDSATKVRGCSTRPRSRPGSSVAGWSIGVHRCSADLVLWGCAEVPADLAMDVLAFLAGGRWLDGLGAFDPLGGRVREGPHWPIDAPVASMPRRTRADTCGVGAWRITPQTWSALDQIIEAEGARPEASGGTAAQARPAGVPVGMQAATQGDRACARCARLGRVGGEPNRQRTPWQSPPGRSGPASVRRMASSPRRVLDPAAFSFRRSLRRETAAAREARRRLPAKLAPPQGWGPGAGGAAAARIRPARRRSD